MLNAREDILRARTPHTPTITNHFRVCCVCGVGFAGSVIAFESANCGVCNGKFINSGIIYRLLKMYSIVYTHEHSHLIIYGPSHIKYMYIWFIRIPFRCVCLSVNESGFRDRRARDDVISVAIASAQFVENVSISLFLNSFFLSMVCMIIRLCSLNTRTSCR